MTMSEPDEGSSFVLRYLYFITTKPKPRNMFLGLIIHEIYFKLLRILYFLQNWLRQLFPTWSDA